MSFDAGSILSTLDLDRTPFTRGLQQAKQDAKKFAEEKLSKIIDVEIRQHIHGQANSMDELAQDQTATVHVHADTREADAELHETEAQVDRLDGRNVDVNTRPAVRSLGEMAAASDAAAGSAAAPGGGGGMMKLLAVGASLAPALAPASGAMALFGAAAFAGMAQAGVAVSAFSKIAQADFKDMQTALKKNKNDIAKIPEYMQPAARAYKQMSDSMDNLKKSTAGSVFGTMTAGFSQAAKLLPTLAPLVDKTANALTKSANSLGKWAAGSDVQGFLKNIGKNIGPELSTATTAIENFGSGFMKIIEDLNPELKLLEVGVQHVSGSFKAWANNTAGGAISGLMTEIKKYGPETVDMLKNLAGTVMNIVKALGGLTGPALGTLDTLFKTLKSVSGTALTPVAKAMGDILTAVTPLLPTLGKLVNTILPPLASAFSAIAKGGIEPLVAGINKQMTPIFKTLGTVMKELSPLISTLVNDFFDFISPTGAGLVGPLINSILKAMIPLIPIVTQVVGAFETLTTQFVADLYPSMKPLQQLIGTLGKSLGEFLKDMLPLVPVIAAVMGALLSTLPPLISALNSLLKVAGPLPGAFLAFIAVRKAEKYFADFGRAGKAVFSSIKLVSGGIKEMTAAARAAGSVSEFFGLLSTGDGKLAKLGAGVTRLGGMMSTFGGKIKDAAVAMKILVPATEEEDAALVANPIGIVVVAVGLLVVAIVELWKHCTTFRNIVKAVWADVKAAFWGTIGWITGTAVPNLVGAYKDMINWFDSVGSGIHRVWSNIEGFFTDAWNWVVSFGKNHWMLILSILLGPIAAAAYQIYSHWNAIEGYFSAAWRWVDGTFHNLWNRVENILGDAVQYGKNLIDRDLTAIRNLFSNLWHWIEWVFKTDWHLLESIMTGPVSTAERVLSGTLHSIRTAFSDAVSFIRRTWSNLRGDIEHPIDSVISFIRNPLVSDINKVLGFVHLPKIPFSSGGYTGNGGVHEPAGVVHKGEVVWSQRDVAAVGGPARANSLRPTSGQGGPGYSIGGIVGDIGGDIGNIFKKGWSGLSWLTGKAVSSLKSMGMAASDLLHPAKWVAGLVSKAIPQSPEFPDGIIHNAADMAVSGLANLISGGAQKQAAQNPGRYMGGGNFGSWWNSALKVAGQSYAKYKNAASIVAHFESGDNPNVVNNWDSNAKRGTPSAGLMQFIEPTFRSFEWPGHDSFMNPVDQILAFFRYSMSRYGSPNNVPGVVSVAHGGGYVGYAGGTGSTIGGLATLGERGVELATGPSVWNLRPGSKIRTASETAKLLGGGSSDTTTMERKLDAIVAALKSLEGTTSEGSDTVAVVVAGALKQASRDTVTQLRKAR